MKRSATRTGPDTMPAGYALRPGRAGESGVLNAIERRAAALLRGHRAHALFSRHVLPAAELEAAAREDRLLVAECGGAAVGYALFGELAGQAHLLQMDVGPAHGRRGVGRALLDATCALAARAGFSSMLLTTLTDVPWNAPFYAGAGFEPVPRARWTPALRALMEEEARLGFPMDVRVAMRRALRDAGRANDGA